LQTIRKTGLLGILLTLLWPVWAADGEEGNAQTSPVIHGTAGHVIGYSPLSMGESSLPATLIPEQLGKPYGKLLILHDSDGGIASSGLVETLRLSLPESGWTTMTIALEYPDSPQLYLVEKATETNSTDEPPTASDTGMEAEQDDVPGSAEEEADSADNNSRVSAALAYLNAQQPGPVVILAIGEAVPLAISAASQQGEDKAQIWIAADVSLTETPELGPLLDITAQDVGHKNRVAGSRDVLMRQADNQAYSQRRFIGAGHDFNGFELQVLSTVRAWLQKQFAAEGQG